VRTPALLVAALLVGCASRRPEPIPSAVPSPFARLPGSPGSARAGFVEPVREGAAHCVVGLSPGVTAKPGELLVSRDRALRPTALLEVEQAQGRVAHARIRRGRPGPKDEAVKPSPELLQLAEALPGT